MIWKSLIVDHASERRLFGFVYVSLPSRTFDVIYESAISNE